MKRWKSLTAALCAAVLLCGFSTTAYAGGGEYEDYGDPTMETLAPEPEPTIEPGQGFSEEGADDFFDELAGFSFKSCHLSVFLLSQNSRPPSRAPSASSATRPWYR